MKLYTCALCSDYVFYTSKFEFDSHFYSVHKADRKKEITEVRTTWEAKQKMDHARSNPPKSSCDREKSNSELEKAGQTHPKTETQTKDVACGNDESRNPLSELMKYLLEPQQSYVTEPIQYRTGSNDPIVFYNYKKSETDQTRRQTIHPDRAPNESENNSEMYDTTSPSSRRQELKRRASSSEVKTFTSSTEPSDEPLSKKPMMFTENDTSPYFFNDSDFDDVEPNDRVSSRQQMADDHEKSKPEMRKTDRKHRQAHFFDRATSKSEKKSKQRSELKRRASSSTIISAFSSTETLADDDEPVSKKRALRHGSTKMNEDDVPRFKFFDDREPNDREQMDNDLREEDERMIKFTSFRSPAKSPEATDPSSSEETPDEDDSEARPRMLNTSDEMPNQDDFQSSVSVADQLMSEITLREADMPTPRRLKIRRSLREIPEVSEDDDDTNDGLDSAPRAADEPVPQRFALRQSSTRRPKRISRPCFRETYRSRASRSSDEVSAAEATNGRASLQEQTEDDAPREADEPMSETVAPAGASTEASEVRANVSVSSIHLLTPQKLQQMRSLMAELLSPQPEGTTSLTINTCFVNSSPADVTLTDSASLRSLQNRDDSLPDLVEGSASKNPIARTSEVVASFSGGISEPKRTSEDELREAYEPVPKKLFLARASKEIVAELNSSSSSVEVSENDVTMDDLTSSDEKMSPEDREESAPTKMTEDPEVDDTQDPVYLKMELMFKDGHCEVAESMAEKNTPEVDVLGSSVKVHEGDETIGRASLKTQTITRHINWINSCRAPSPSVTVNKQLLLKEASRKAAEPMPEKLEVPLASQGIPEVNASRSSDKASENVPREAVAAAAKPLPKGTSEIDDASRSSDKVREDDETKNRANLDERAVETEFGDEADEPMVTKISPPRTSITKVEASHSSVERPDDAKTREDSLPPRREESIPVSEKLASTPSTETTSSASTSCSSGNTFGNIDRPLNDGASSDKRTTKLRSIRHATKRKSDRSNAGPSTSVEQVSVGQVSVGQASVGQVSVEQVSVGQASVGQVSVGQVSVGQASVRQASVGQVSVGQATVGQVSSSHQSFITPPFYNNPINSYPNYIPIPQVTSSMNPQYSSAFGLVSVPPPPPATAPFYNYSFGNYQNPGATINATTGINYPPFRRQNYYQPTNNLIHPAPPQVSSLYVPPPTAPFYNYPSGTYQNSDATMNGSMQNYYQPTNNLIHPAPPQVSSQYVPPPTAPFYNYPSGTYQNLDATMNGSMQSFHQPINNLIRPTPQVPMNNLIRPTPQVPMNNLIRPTPQVPMNNLLPPTQQVPIDNLIPPTPQVPIDNLISPTPQVHHPSTSYQDPGAQNNVAEAKAMPMRPKPVYHPSTSYQDPGAQNNVTEAKAMPVPTKTMGLYPCGKCPEVSRSRRQYEEHKKQPHPQPNQNDDNEEPPGKKRCASQEANDKRPKCDECRFNFYHDCQHRAQRLKDASSISANQGTQVRPTTSSSTSVNQQAQVLPSTSGASSTSEFPCQRCPRVFANQNKLNFHIAQEHVVMRCEACRKKPRFPKLDLLLEHMQQTHRKDARKHYGFMCNLCDRSCASTPDWIGHMQTHAHRRLDAQRERWQANNENIRGNLEITQQQHQQPPPAVATASTSAKMTKRFKCTGFRCDESFRQEILLYMHKMYTHKDYACYICHRKCLDKQDFEAHMERFHSDVWRNSK